MLVGLSFVDDSVWLQWRVKRRRWRTEEEESSLEEEEEERMDARARRVHDRADPCSKRVGGNANKETNS